MPTIRKSSREAHSKPSASTSASVSNSSVTRRLVPVNVIHSLDIIALILKSLPVKSIARFKCVSKPWLELVSSPRFITMHRHQTSQNPCNRSFIIHSIGQHYHHNIYLLKFNSAPPNEPVIPLVNPYPVLFKEMELVDSINGVVCLSCPPLGQMIVLWNPAMNLYKNISLPKSEPGEPVEEEDLVRSSVGLAYDSANDDYKIIRIAWMKPKCASCPDAPLRVLADVYSANLDSWSRAQIDIPFFVSDTRSDVIAKGIPYWLGTIDQAGKFTDVLVYYDIPSGKFENVPMPPIDGYECTRVILVEWEGNLGSIMLSPCISRVNFVDIFVYDEELGTHWNKVSSHGPIPIERKVERHMQFSENSVIVAETPKGKLVLYDPITNGIKVFRVPKAKKLSFEAFCYTESLVSFKKMEHVKEQDKPKDLAENATRFLSNLKSLFLCHS